MILFPGETAREAVNAGFEPWEPCSEDWSQDRTIGDSHAEARFDDAPHIGACRSPSEIRRGVEICVGEIDDAENCYNNVTADISII